MGIFYSQKDHYLFQNSCAVFFFEIILKYWIIKHVEKHEKCNWCTVNIKYYTTFNCGGVINTVFNQMYFFPSAQKLMKLSLTSFRFLAFRFVFVHIGTSEVKPEPLSDDTE